MFGFRLGGQDGLVSAGVEAEDNLRAWRMFEADPL